MKLKTVFMFFLLLTLEVTLVYADGFNPKDIKAWWLYENDDGLNSYADMLNKEVGIKLKLDRLQNLKDVPTDFLKGKYTLVDIWATWCSPCLAGIPENNEIFKKHNEKLNVIGICTSKNSADFETVVISKGIIYPVGVDTSGAISEYFRIKLFPTYFLIDPQGKLIVADIKADHLHDVLDVVLKD